MSRQYFGTDGVRGRVGGEPMTVEFALRLASAAARVLAPEGGTVLVGKDTRLSGYMFEAALEARLFGQMLVSSKRRSDVNVISNCNYAQRSC